MGTVATTASATATPMKAFRELVEPSPLMPQAGIVPALLLAKLGRADEGGTTRSSEASPAF